MSNSARGIPNLATPVALAVTWMRFMRATDEPGTPYEESATLIEQADQVLDRLAETPAVTEAALAAKILVWNCECDGGDSIIGMRLRASIVADARRLGGPELAGMFPDPMWAESRGLLDEARERGAVWAREHVLRPRGTAPDLLRQVLAQTDPELILCRKAIIAARRG